MRRRKPKMPQAIAALAGGAALLAVAALVEGCGSSSALAEDDDSSDSTRYARGPVTIERVTARIRATALEFWQNGLVANRVGFSDIAFPKDATEFGQMAGHGLILVTVVTRDSTELPPERVYVRTPDGDVVLQPLFGSYVQEVWKKRKGDPNLPL